ncbi:MAG: hypothetical protein IPF60_16170 [Betaproteobacteria bacterium]|nr:hypothetical protein [Betaproteobacteria bacterium]
MNKRDKAREAQQVRAMLLRINAVHHTHGVYAYALRAAHGRTIPKMLHELTQVVANNTPMTIDERIFLIQMLPALAEGFDVRGSCASPRARSPQPGTSRAQCRAGARGRLQRIADGEVRPRPSPASPRSSARNPRRCARRRRARRKGGQ